MQQQEKKKQNTKKIDEWQAENVERIVIKPRKEDRISERIQALIDAGKCKSKQAYIINAVKSKLEEDDKTLELGIPKCKTKETEWDLYLCAKEGHRGELLCLLVDNNIFKDIHGISFPVIDRYKEDNKTILAVSGESIDQIINLFSSDSYAEMLETFAYVEKDSQHYLKFVKSPDKIEL